MTHNCLEHTYVLFVPAVLLMGELESVTPPFSIFISLNPYSSYTIPPSYSLSSQTFSVLRSFWEPNVRRIEPA